MITRIVKMTFQDEKCQDFENYFREIVDQIAGQPGCHHVKLLRETEGNVFFTYSIWDDQLSLDAYRNTELFAQVWPKVKKWFADKPQAWSTTLIKES